MEPTASSLVDLCLEDVLQDVTGDDSSPERASEGWSLADREASTNNQQAGPAEPEEVTSEQQYRDEDNKHISQAEMEMADESEGQQEENTTDTAADVQSQSEAYAEPEPESVPTQSSLPQQDQFIIEQSLQRAPTDTEEQLAEAPETKHPSGHAQKDRSAALLSKELRKLQAETTVLQEHSRRLQEKAAVIQQQRAADQAKEQGRLTGDYLKQPSLNQRESGEQFHSNGSNVELSSNRASHTGPQAQAQGGSAGQPRRESQQQSEAQAEMQAEQEPLYQRQGSSSAGTDSQPAYLYISDATTPSQDGALQWSIGGVPLQQQLRLSSADNGMEADEATLRQEPPQGLQWGSTIQAGVNTLKKKKSVALPKQPKDSQAGNVNSIAALYNAQTKQVLNPLKMRKAPQGAAANPVIRQRSVAQQAKHKQHFADTLRRNNDSDSALANEQSMQSMHSMPHGQSMHSGQNMSRDALQQQPQDHAEHAGAYYRAQLEPYGSALASSKSEPHGLYSKSAAQLYAAQLASSGLPKANSMHDLDMGQPQPAAPKRRARVAARRNAPSAPSGAYAQGWGQPGAQPAYPGTMPGMQSGMVPQQGMPLLPQLGPAHMGISYRGAPQAFQQPFAPPQGLQGPSQPGTKRGLGRQAGSALPLPDMGTAHGPFGNYTAQQQQQASMMQNWGSPFAAPQQSIPMQYAQHAAAMSQPSPNAFGGHPSAASGGYPGVQSTSMLPRRAKIKGPAFGQPGMQQAYTAGAMAGPMPPPGYPNQPVQFAGGMTQMSGATPWGSGAATQQRADDMQQYQLQHYQQMQNNVMQHLQQNENHALLKYGNFDNTTYRQSDLQSRPEFRTY